jgi:hypothetical protein
VGPISLINDQQPIFPRLFVLLGGSLLLLAEDVSALGEDLISIGFSDLCCDRGFLFGEEVLLVVTTHLRIINELKAGESIWKAGDKWGEYWRGKGAKMIIY